jgi:uncharacterized protein (TIGR02611 family)
VTLLIGKSDEIFVGSVKDHPFGGVNDLGSGHFGHKAPPANDPARPARRAGLRHRLRTHPLTRHPYRLGVAVAGVAVVAGGLVLLPLPGPGWLIIFLGLGILASEFAWAARLLSFARATVRGWTRWLSRQPVAVRALLGLVGAVVVVGAVAGYVAWRGVPFMPD